MQESLKQSEQRRHDEVVMVTKKAIYESDLEVAELKKQIAALQEENASQKQMIEALRKGAEHQRKTSAEEYLAVRQREIKFQQQRDDLKEENAKLQKRLEVAANEKHTLSQISDVHCDELRALEKQRDALAEALKPARELAEALETCHVCKGTVLLIEESTHCEDCSGDCDSHDEPECEPLQSIHSRLKAALASVDEQKPSPSGNCFSFTGTSTGVPSNTFEVSICKRCQRPRPCAWVVFDTQCECVDEQKQQEPPK